METLNDFVMPWGKYKGDKIQDVPRKYLEYIIEWIEENGLEDDNEDLLEAIEYTKKVRDRSHDKY